MCQAIHPASRSPPSSSLMDPNVCLITNPMSEQCDFSETFASVFRSIFSATNAFFHRRLAPPGSRPATATTAATPPIYI